MPYSSVKQCLFCTAFCKAVLSEILLALVLGKASSFECLGSYVGWTLERHFLKGSIRSSFLIGSWSVLHDRYRTQSSCLPLSH